MQLRASLDVQGGYVQPGASSHAILKSIENRRVSLSARWKKDGDSDEGIERRKEEWRGGGGTRARKGESGEGEKERAELKRHRNDTAS